MNSILAETGIFEHGIAAGIEVILLAIAMVGTMFYIGILLKKWKKEKKEEKIKKFNETIKDICNFYPALMIISLLFAFSFIGDFGNIGNLSSSLNASLGIAGSAIFHGLNSGAIALSWEIWLIMFMVGIGISVYNLFVDINELIKEKK